MPPKKSTTENKFKYSRQVTLQVQQFCPETVSFEDYIEKNEPITDEDRIAVIKKVDELIKSGRQKLIAIRDNNGVEPDNYVENSESTGELNINKNSIYVPKRCKDLSMKFSRGKFLVSVTSIFSYLYPIDFPKDALQVYADRGTLVHSTWEHCILNKAVVKPSEYDPVEAKRINETPITLFPPKKFNLNVDDCNPSGFLEKYKDEFEFEVLEADVSNYELGFYGRLDLRGKHNSKVCLGDVKTASSYSSDKLEKHFKQLAAYSLCYDDIEELIVIPLNPKNKAGYGAPLVTNEVEKYQKLFLEDLKKFQEEVQVVYV